MPQCVFDYKIVDYNARFINCIYDSKAIVDFDSLDKDSIDEVVININCTIVTNETDDCEYNQVDVNYLNCQIRDHIYQAYNSARDMSGLKEIPYTINTRVRHLNSKGENIWNSEILGNLEDYVYNFDVNGLSNDLVFAYQSDITEINFDCESVPIFIENATGRVFWQVEDYNIRKNYKLKDCAVLVILSPMQIIPTDKNNHDAIYDKYEIGSHFAYSKFMDFGLKYMYPTDVMIHAEDSSISLHRYDKIIRYRDFNGSFDFTEKNQLDIVGLYARLRDEINYTNKVCTDPNPKESYIKAEFVDDKNLTFYVDFSDEIIQHIFSELMWVTGCLTYSRDDVKTTGFFIWKCDFLNSLYYFNEVNLKNPYALPPKYCNTSSNTAYLRSGDIFRRLLLIIISAYINNQDIRDILTGNVYLLNMSTKLYDDLINANDLEEVEMFVNNHPTDTYMLERMDYRFFSDTCEDCIEFCTLYCYNGVSSEDYYKVIRTLRYMYVTSVVFIARIIFDNCDVKGSEVVSSIFDSDTVYREIHLRNNTHVFTDSFNRENDFLTLAQKDVDVLMSAKDRDFNPASLKRVSYDATSSISLLNSYYSVFSLSDTDTQGNFYIASYKNLDDSDIPSWGNTRGREYLHWLPIGHNVFKLVDSVVNSISPHTDSNTNNTDNPLIIDLDVKSFN